MQRSLHVSFSCTHTHALPIPHLPLFYTICITSSRLFPRPDSSVPAAHQQSAKKPRRPRKLPTRTRHPLRKETIQTQRNKEKTLLCLLLQHIHSFAAACRSKPERRPYRKCPSSASRKLSAFLIEADENKDDDFCERAKSSVDDFSISSSCSSFLSPPLFFSSALILRSFPLLWLLDNAPKKPIIVSDCLSVLQCSCESGRVCVSEFRCVCLCASVCLQHARVLL